MLELKIHINYDIEKLDSNNEELNTNWSNGFFVDFFIRRVYR